MSEASMDKALHRQTRTAAIVSGKGGVGKSTVSVNLAIAMARLKRDVLIMDADLGLANIDVLLGLRPKGNLEQVLEGERELSDIVLKGPENISVLPAVSGVGKMANLSNAEYGGLIGAFEGYKEPVDLLLVDAAAGISNDVVSFAKAVDDIIVVVCDEPASVTDAYALIKVLNKEHGIKQFRVLANMVRSDSQGFDLYQTLVRTADRFMNVGLSYLGSIPHDDAQRQAAVRQRAVSEMFPNSRIAAAYDQLATRFDALKSQRKVSGRLQFFVEQLLKNEEAEPA